MRGVLAAARPWSVLSALLAVPALSQTNPTMPVGFAAEPVFVEASQGAVVRGAVHAPGFGWFVALGRTLQHRPDPQTRLTPWSLPPGDDIAWLLFDAPGARLLGGALRQGIVFVHDPATATTTTYQGVANAFDAVPLPNGDLLLSANPNWPAPGASSGIWLVGPTRSPRELLRLNGPSGPLTLDRSGNLLVAELGTVIPVPPGGARLLRFPAARVVAAIAGTTLTIADADRQSPGWNGLYDLEFDDRGCLHVSDSGSSTVLRTWPGTLTRDPSAAIDVGTGFAGLQLQFEPATTAPFAAFQPAERASSLLVGASDFVGRHEVLRLHPQRPDLGLWPGTTFGAGTARATVTNAPAGGFGVFAGSAHPLVPERAVALLDALPVWFALDDRQPIATRIVPLDANGTATTALIHPGGFAGQVHLQAFTLTAAGIGQHGSTAAVTVTLLP